MRERQLADNNNKHGGGDVNMVYTSLYLPLLQSAGKADGGRAAVSLGSSRQPGREQRAPISRGVGSTATLLLAYPKPCTTRLSTLEGSMCSHVAPVSVVLMSSTCRRTAPVRSVPSAGFSRALRSAAIWSCRLQRVVSP